MPAGARTPRFGKGAIAGDRPPHYGYWVFFNVIGDTIFFKNVEKYDGSFHKEAPLLSPLDSEKWEDDRILDIPLTP